MALQHRIDQVIAELRQMEPQADALGPLCHDALREVVDHEMSLWFSLDPATLLPTRFSLRFHDSLMDKMNNTMMNAFGMRRPFELMMMRRIMRYEFDIDDSLSPWALAKTPGRAATLRGVTGGDPSRSPRVESHPIKGALFDELRLMLTDAGECWGMIWLGRKDRAFEEEDIRAASTMGPALGQMVRLSFLRAAVAGSGSLSEPPGLVLMDETGAVDKVSDEAERLLGPSEKWDWLAVLRAIQDKGREASMVVEGSGGPVTIHVSRFGGQDALIAERVRPTVLADRLVRAYGLTKREREVVGALSQGWSTRRIAFELDIADYTVQDHLQAIFSKVGVRSRKEVMSKLFFENYVPEHNNGAIPSPYGWFIED